ncbi:MAG: DegT/DnrJ/EryC1/StrS family aminotransferase [Paludibacteraceae bacterium]|nr:DegT/DnrJ/EryC1/StrS family aminotransferase [Paludibacteraceae bacterium]
MDNSIQMCDLVSQYEGLKEEIDAAVSQVMSSGRYIKGLEVESFENELAEWIGSKNCISCGNGTDALYLALLALDLKPGTEVITPSFTFVASVEAIVRAGLKPVYADVDKDTFCVTRETVEKVITPNTGAIIVVHLFGQCCDMDSLMDLGKSRGIRIIEDACQSIGSGYTFQDGSQKRGGAIADIGCTSFFPSKNLGCMGDGGALFTNNDHYAAKIRSLANHGMAQRYHYQYIGINSRLDAIQAAILRVKLRHIGEFFYSRSSAAVYYDSHLSGDLEKYISIPSIQKGSVHTYNQYTIKVSGGKRDLLRNYLADKGVPTMVYYPNPIHLQPPYMEKEGVCLPVTESLCNEVLSLPMHTELSESIQERVVNAIKCFYRV